jgi:hypothetical protein
MSVIKSMQRGRTTVLDTPSATISVSAVTLAKAFSRCEYYVGQGRGGRKAGCYLTGNTTLTYSAESDGSSGRYLYWHVIEFN